MCAFGTIAPVVWLPGPFKEGFQSLRPCAIFDFASCPSAHGENRLLRVPSGDSISAPRTSHRAVAQLGRAPRSGRGGREFESRRPDHLIDKGECAPARFERQFDCDARSAKVNGRSHMAELAEGEIISPARPLDQQRRVCAGEVRTSVRLRRAEARSGSGTARRCEGRSRPTKKDIGRGGRRIAKCLQPR